MRIYPVIMSGGSGTRLWPLSRQKRPKQYLTLSDGTSLIGRTLKRCSPNMATVEVAPPIIIGAVGHEDLLKQAAQEHDVSPLALILEPIAKNTAVVAAIAAAYVKRIDPDGLILMLPADHHIQDEKAFWAYVEAGMSVAERGRIITFGIQPNAPETGYGYIRKGEAISGNCYEVHSFREKPDLATAQGYLAAGIYSWNAGIFLFAAETMLQEFNRYEPAILKVGTAALADASWSENVATLSYDALYKSPSISIDYAIMEKTGLSAMMGPIHVGWDDIGSWVAFNRLNETEDKMPNIVEIAGGGNRLVSTGRIIAAIGVQNLVVVETADAVLVVHKEHVQKVGDVVKLLKETGREDML